MPEETWKIRGDYFENCNCEILCPCIYTMQQAPPTQGHCDVPLAFHIDEGRYEGLSLDGLNVVLIATVPGPMHQPRWTVGLYVDEHASPLQRDALEKIFTGQAGGPMARLSSLIEKNLGVKSVPISYEKKGRRRRVTIPTILEMNVEGFAGLDDEAIWLDNVPHPASRRLALAHGTKTTFQDYGLHWDNSGKNGHYSPFSWASG